jgi:DNA modification methylase
LTGVAIVTRGDARSLQLPDDSVDLIVTSPPYFALRSYTDGGEHYAGQIGSEATPAEFLAALLDCTREWMRVLKPTGSLWVNLGDKYAAAGGHTDRGENSTLAGRRAVRQTAGAESRTITGGVRQKSLMGLPWRYALGCIDALGLILRAEVVWSKPNGLPESVTDRVRRSHEQWFHFTLQPQYYSAVDEVREQYAPGTAARYAAGYNARQLDSQRPSVSTKLGGDQYDANPLGKTPGSVWEIPTEPLTVPAHLGVDHFAAFPTEWPRRIIAGWSPRDVCSACGAGRRPIVDVHHEPAGGNAGQRGRLDADEPTNNGRGINAVGSPKLRGIATITAYVCGCPDTAAATTPGVVLDPFGGTGTVALVAKALGRVGISNDLSADYCRLAQWRTNDPGQLAKAMRVAKPPAQADGQTPLFGEVPA